MEVEAARFVVDVAQAARSVAEVIKMEVAKATRPKDSNVLVGDV